MSLLRFLMTTMMMMTTTMMRMMETLSSPLSAVLCHFQSTSRSPRIYIFIFGAGFRCFWFIKQSAL